MRLAPNGSFPIRDDRLEAEQFPTEIVLPRREHLLFCVVRPEQRLKLERHDFLASSDVPDGLECMRRTKIGIAMLVLAGIGFLINLIQMALSVFGLFVSIVLPYLPFRRIPADEKFAKVVHKAMERVSLLLSMFIAKLEDPAWAMLVQCVRLRSGHSSRA